MSQSPPTDSTLEPPVSVTGEDVRDLVSFRLWRMTMANDRLANRLLRERFGITLVEWRLLAVCRAMQPARLGDALDELKMDKGQASRVIKGLTERELLVSAPDPDDQRRVVISLTEAGEALHARGYAFAAERNRMTLDLLDPAEAAVFERVVGKLRTRLERMYQDLEDAQ